MNNTLYLVVPCYNEEKVLEETTKRLDKKFDELIAKGIISKKSKVLFVNDGSSDNTWELIKEFNKNNKRFTGISLSKNRGHQNAVVAGLMEAKNYADVVISMDADLQDDINAIDSMMHEYSDNNIDIVYGVRSSRMKDSIFKRFTAETYYKVLKFMGVDVVFNHADFRLTSKRVLDLFEQYKEVNLFLRGIFPTMGFNTSIVYYKREERFAGESKYSLKKMLSLAWDGITSFSIQPLRFICMIGIIITLISVIIGLYSIVQKILGNTVPGWTFIMLSIWLIGGLQMLSIGIIGEYLGKVYIETKQRPRYFIQENLNNQKNLN